MLKLCWRASVVVLGFVAMLSPLAAQDRPNYGEMRAHVISKLTDEQIRALHERAPREFEESRRREDERIRRDDEERAERWKKCQDIVFKERNPNQCRFGALITEPIRQYKSVQDAYEKLLMGICLFAQTKAEAVQYGCLPGR